MQRELFYITTVLSLAVAATADVRVPNLFSDHMVLQRDKAIKVWGWANPGERVNISTMWAVACLFRRSAPK